MALELIVAVRAESTTSAVVRVMIPNPAQESGADVVTQLVAAPGDVHTVLLYGERWVQIDEIAEPAAEIAPETAA
jgi:hypothetical protein